MKANGIEPWTYLYPLFDVMPRATTPEEIEALLLLNAHGEAIRPR